MNSDRDPSPPAEAKKSGFRSGCPGIGVYNKWAGYAAHPYESRWGPWNFSGVGSPPKRSPSPDEEEEEYAEDDEDDEDYDAEEDEEEEEEEEYGKEDIYDSPRNAADVSQEPAFRVGGGLTNLGNTCYLNAVLQCLIHIYPLQQGLSMVKHDKFCFLDFCLICELRLLARGSFELPDVNAPRRIVANLKYFSPDFERYQQEDAHEFLQCVLNKLEKYSICSSDPFSSTPSDNLVKQVFGGSLVSRLRCSNCNHISSTPENLIDFSLEIDHVNTLEGALGSFTKPEKIEDTSLICVRCNEMASIEKQFMVDKAPIVASFHLKRFKSDGTTVEKIGKHIDYPLTLNLNPYTVGHPEYNAGLIYDLYAVIVHLGYSSNSGHYFCFVRSSPSVWHEFDDSTVTRVSESYVLSQGAYILFYAKHEATWFFNGDEVRSLCPPIISPNSVLDNCNQSGDSDSSTESLHRCDVLVNKHEEDNVATCQTAFSGPQHVNTELVEKIGHGKVPDLLPSDEGDDKNEVRLDDSSFHFDMLLNAEANGNRINTNDPPLNFDVMDEPTNNTSKEVVDKRGSLLDSRPNILTCQEHVDITREQIFSTTISNSAESSAMPSLVEASNLINRNSISPGRSLTMKPSSLASSSSSRDDTILEKRIFRKRPAKKPPEDQRKRHFKVPI